MGFKLFKGILLIFLCCFTSCSRKENLRMEEVSDHDNTIVAAWEKTNFSTQKVLNPMLMEDVLYYWSGDWDSDSMSWSNTTIYRKQCGEEIPQEIVSLGAKELIFFLVDEEHNLYYLYSDNIDDEKEFFFRRDSEVGEVVYDNLISATEEERQRLYDINQGGYVTQGAVNRQGEVCFCNPLGELYLFDKNGNFLCIRDGTWEDIQGGEKGLVNAGDSGVFTYVIGGKKILLREINMTDGSLGSILEIEVDGEASLDVYSGYGRGILISDSSILWEYSFAEKEMEKILDWGADNVNLKGYEISLIGMAESGKVNTLVRSLAGSKSELVSIENMEVSEKQVVMLGVLEFKHNDEATELEKMAAEFNKYNHEY